MYNWMDVKVCTFIELYIAQCKSIEFLTHAVIAATKRTDLQEMDKWSSSNGVLVDKSCIDLLLHILAHLAWHNGVVYVEH